MSLSSPPITEETAELLLLPDVANAERTVTAWVRPPLNANQFSALVSFVFNVGQGWPGVEDGFVWLKSGRPSSLISFLNQGRLVDAANEFPKWRFADGRELPGLVKRRAAERALFLKPVIAGGKDFA